MLTDCDISVAGLISRGAAIQRALRPDRLGRRELSALEHELEQMLAGLEPWWCSIERDLGPTPEVRLAEAAVHALEESVRWARSFRKHAPLRERRERIERGLEGALGASHLLLRVTSLRAGPQLADVQEHR